MLINYKKARNVLLNIGDYWFSYITSVANNNKESDQFISVISGKKLNIQSVIVLKNI